MFDPPAQAHGRLPWPAWQPWVAVAGFAFALHFVWEFLQVPFYREMAAMPHWDATLICLQATVGDVGLTLLAYGAVALIVRDQDWISELSRRRLALFVVTGLIATAAVELPSVHVWGRWEYAPIMPTIFGLGATPLLQWIVIPPAVLWLSRRHLGQGPYQRAASEHM